MPNRFQATLVLVLVVPILAGCSNTPKHSNVLIFGTNTRIGLNAGYDPKTQNGDILLGYNRQELVWMPLLANTAKDGLGLDTQKNNLFYIGKDKNDETDTYSVIASLGATFNAKAASSTEAGGGIAQFFATGLAARTLATKGSDLLSVPSDKQAEARTAEANAQAAQSDALKAQLSSMATQEDAARTSILSTIAKTVDSNLPPFFTKAIALNLIPNSESAATGDPSKTPPVAANYQQMRQDFSKFMSSGDDSERLKNLQAFQAFLSAP